MTASAAEKLDKSASAHSQKRHVRPYPEYRDTGIKALGSIPATWEIKRAKYLFWEVNERSSDGLETLLSVSEYYGVKPKSETIDENEHISRADSLEGYKKCQKDDLVMNIMLAWKCGHGVTEYEGIVSPAYSVFRMDKRQVLPKYVHYLSRTPQYTGYFKTLSTGIIDSRLRLYPDKFGMIFFVLPSLSTQQSIADFLDRETARIDNLIAEKQNFINLLKEKRQALISHVVTKGLDPKAKMKESGIQWIGEVPEHWSVGRVKHLASIISKGTTPSTIGGEFVEEGVRFLKAENIGKSFFVSESPAFYISESVDEQLVRSRLKESDVLVIIAGATTGKCSVITSDLLPANTNQAVSFIRPKCKAHSFFIAYWLESKFAQDKIWQDAVQAAQPNLSMEDLGNLNITIPPDEEVETIVSSITTSCNRLANLENETLNSIELLKAHRTALISAAVTGKIDVRAQQ